MSKEEVNYSETEEWRNIEIEDFKNKYEVSNLGNIRTVKNKKLLKQQSSKEYSYIHLRKSNTKSFNTSIHRIVALTFLDKPSDPNMKYVNHKNGNKFDNRVSNLEWVTNSDNIKHAHDNQIITQFKLPVCNYDLNGNFIKRFESITQAAKEYDYDISNIYKACDGKLKTYKNFIWKFENEAAKKEEITSFPEESVPIKDMKENYRITKNGEIFSNLRGKIKKMKPVKRNNYMAIRLLDKDNNRKTLYIHRLVAITFLENPENKEQVNHKDLDKMNNHVSNLEWITNSENLKHRYK